MASLINLAVIIYLGYDLAKVIRPTMEQAQITAWKYFGLTAELFCQLGLIELITRPSYRSKLRRYDTTACNLE